MWWAVVTLSTTGYGDEIPQSLAGRILAGVVMTSGIGVFALWAGILATGFAEEVRRQDFVRKWQLVSAVPLFQKLGSPELVGIVRALRPRNLSAGAVICRKGETGDQMFFIVEGHVSVATASPVELGPGTFFGEMALITGEPRSATVVASTRGVAAVAAFAGFPGAVEPQSGDRRDHPQDRPRAPRPPRPNPETRRPASSPHRSG